MSRSTSTPSAFLRRAAVSIARTSPAGSPRSAVSDRRVHAAAGGVGLIASQWARELGATVLRLTLYLGVAIPLWIPQSSFVLGALLLTAGAKGIEVPANVGHQYLEPSEEAAFMKADEYDALIEDPTGFLYNVWLPRVSTSSR